MQVRAVIFDCFGVLTTDGFFGFCDRHFADQPEQMTAAVSLNRQVDSGRLAWPDMVEQLANLADIAPKAARAELGSSALNEPLFRFIGDQLKPSYRIGLLSNVGHDWPAENFETWQLELFDEMVLSYQLGQPKPEAVMYETIASKLGMLPEECLFIDDRELFCQGAEAVGMATILFTSTHQAIRAVSQWLSLSDATGRSSSSL